MLSSVSITLALLIGHMPLVTSSTQAAFCTHRSGGSVSFSLSAENDKNEPSSASSSPPLFQKRVKPTWFEEQEDLSQVAPVRYLGKGEDAIIRPGVVLVAPSHEYHHFLTKSAVFVQAIGLDKFGEHVTRGVIIDHPTVFTMGEMATGAVTGVLANNLLFQGGDQGGDKAIMLHGKSDIGRGNMIGTSGIFEGGLDAAMEAADFGETGPEKFKFFFNHVEFTDNELANMMGNVDSEGDAWMSVEVPVEMILDSDMNRGDAWRSLRNELKAMAIEDQQY